MIEVHRLVKGFGHQLAIAGLDLEAGPGDVLGLIGPNGAGKSTTLRVLATLEQADAGTVRIAGFDTRTEVEDARRSVGFMPERFGLYDELTVRDALDFFARVLGLESKDRRRRVDALLELCDLHGKASSGCGSLSKGVRQRLYVAKTLLTDPPVLLLDEPASGLDPRARIEFRELLRELASRGKTVMISSHILSELDAICTRAVVVEGGRVRFAGRMSELQSRSRALRMRATLLDESDIAALAALREALERDERISEVASTGAQVMFSFAGERAELVPLLAELVTGGHPLVGFAVEDGGLESLFLEFTEGQIT